MGLKDDVVTGVAGVLAPAWSIRDGQVVPEDDDIVLKNGAVRLQATYLYADMADSTALAQNYTKEATAKVIRSYLNAATRIIRARGGAIRSFDGDRVMGIFVGNRKNNDAVEAAMNISWAVDQVINPKLKEKWSDLKWTMGHGVGVDTGEALLVRGGVHGTNDIVSIGSAPNVAAKLSEERGSWINISSEVHSYLDEPRKFNSAGQSMWADKGTRSIGGKLVRFYGSGWYRIP
jgi:adenylate cyclase